ncbi:MAG: hypothetical protein HQ549_07245, partial [Candidatus Omnitrophica bacterium]|nr:hypothetical protein [Candidatus Omnitrophota bacterium]
TAGWVLTIGLSLIPGVGILGAVLGVWILFVVAHFVRTENMPDPPPLSTVLGIALMNAVALGVLLYFQPLGMFSSFQNLASWAGIIYLVEFVATTGLHWSLNLRHVEDTTQALRLAEDVKTYAPAVGNVNIGHQIAEIGRYAESLKVGKTDTIDWAVNNLNAYAISIEPQSYEEMFLAAVVVDEYMNVLISEKWNTYRKRTCVGILGSIAKGRSPVAQYARRRLKDAYIAKKISKQNLKETLGSTGGFSLWMEKTFRPLANLLATKFGVIPPVVIVPLLFIPAVGIFVLAIVIAFILLKKPAVAQISSPVVTRDEIAKVIDWINESAGKTIFDDGWKARTVEKISNMGLVKGRRFLVVGPGSQDYLPIILTKLGLETSIIDIDLKAIAGQASLCRSFDVENKIDIFASYDSIRVQPFDYISVFAVVQDALRPERDEELLRLLQKNLENIRGGIPPIWEEIDRHCTGKMREMISPILEHLNPNGGHLFITNNKQHTAAEFRQDPSLTFDDGKELFYAEEALVSIGLERGIHFNLQAQVDIDNLNTSTLSWAELRKGAVYKSETFEPSMLVSLDEDEKGAVKASIVILGMLIGLASFIFLLPESNVAGVIGVGVGAAIMMVPRYAELEDKAPVATIKTRLTNTLFRLAVFAGSAFIIGGGTILGYQYLKIPLSSFNSMFSCINPLAYYIGAIIIALVVSDKDWATSIKSIVKKTEGRLKNIARVALILSVVSAYNIWMAPLVRTAIALVYVYAYPRDEEILHIKGENIMLLYNSEESKNIVVEKLSVLPPNHLRAINKIRIFEPFKDMPFGGFANPLLPNEIAVLAHKDGYGEKGLYHELGHVLMARLSREQLDEWKALHSQSENPEGFVSTYASSNHKEDFAETYRSYTQGLGFFVAKDGILRRKMLFMARHLFISEIDGEKRLVMYRGGDSYKLEHFSCPVQGEPRYQDIQEAFSPIRFMGDSDSNIQIRMWEFIFEMATLDEFKQILKNTLNPKWSKIDPAYKSVTRAEGRFLKINRIAFTNVMSIKDMALRKPFIETAIEFFKGARNLKPSQGLSENLEDMISDLEQFNSDIDSLSEFQKEFPKVHVNISPEVMDIYHIPTFVKALKDIAGKSAIIEKGISIKFTLAEKMIGKARLPDGLKIDVNGVVVVLRPSSKRPTFYLDLYVHIQNAAVKAEEISKPQMKNVAKEGIDELEEIHPAIKSAIEEGHAVAVQDLVHADLPALFEGSDQDIATRILLLFTGTLSPQAEANLVLHLGRAPTRSRLYNGLRNAQQLLQASSQVDTLSLNRIVIMLDDAITPDLIPVDDILAHTGSGQKTGIKIQPTIYITLSTLNAGTVSSDGLLHLLQHEDADNRRGYHEWQNHEEETSVTSLWETVAIVARTKRLARASAAAMAEERRQQIIDLQSAHQEAEDAGVAVESDDTAEEIRQKINDENLRRVSLEGARQAAEEAGVAVDPEDTPQAIQRKIVLANRDKLILQRARQAAKEAGVDIGPNDTPQQIRAKIDAREEDAIYGKISTIDEYYRVREQDGRLTSTRQTEEGVFASSPTEQVVQVGEYFLKGRKNARALDCGSGTGKAVTLLSLYDSYVKGIEINLNLLEQSTLCVDELNNQGIVDKDKIKLIHGTFWEENFSNYDLIYIYWPYSASESNRMARRLEQKLLRELRPDAVLVINCNAPKKLKEFKALERIGLPYEEKDISPSISAYKKPSVKPAINEGAFRFNQYAYTHIPEEVQDISDERYRRAKQYVFEIFKKVNREEALEASLNGIKVTNVIDESKLSAREFSSSLFPTAICYEDGQIEINANFIKFVAYLRRMDLNKIVVRDRHRDKKSRLLTSIVYSIALHEIRGHYIIESDGNIQFTADESRAQLERGFNYRRINVDAILFYWLSLCENRTGGSLRQRLLGFLNTIEPETGEKYAEILGILGENAIRQCVSSVCHLSDITTRYRPSRYVSTSETEESAYEKAAQEDEAREYAMNEGTQDDEALPSGINKIILNITGKPVDSKDKKKEIGKMGRARTNRYIFNAKVDGDTLRLGISQEGLLREGRGVFHRDIEPTAGDGVFSGTINSRGLKLVMQYGIWEKEGDGWVKTGEIKRTPALEERWHDDMIKIARVLIANGIPKSLSMENEYSEATLLNFAFKPAPTTLGELADAPLLSAVPDTDMEQKLEAIKTAVAPFAEKYRKEDGLVWRVTTDDTSGTVGAGVYMPSRYSDVVEMLRVVGIEGKNFLDLGSGTGDVVFIAAAMGAARAKGIEFNRDLHRDSEEGALNAIRDLDRSSPQLGLNSSNVEFEYSNYLNKDVSISDQDVLYWYYNEGVGYTNMDDLMEKILTTKFKPGTKFIAYTGHIWKGFNKWDGYDAYQGCPYHIYVADENGSFAKKETDDDMKRLTPMDDEQTGPWPDQPLDGFGGVQIDLSEASLADGEAGQVIDVKTGDALREKIHPEFLMPHYKIGLQRYYNYLRERGFENLLRVELTRKMTKTKGEIAVTAITKGRGDAAKEQRKPTGDVLQLDEKGYPVNVTLDKKAEHPSFSLTTALEEQGHPMELVLRNSVGNGWYFNIPKSVLLCPMNSFLEWYEREKGERLDPNKLSVTEYAGHTDNPRIEISKKGEKTNPLAVMEMKKGSYPEKLAKGKRGFTLFAELQRQHPEIYGEVSPKSKKLERGQREGFTWTPIYYTFLDNFFKHLDTLKLGTVKSIIVREVDDVREIEGQKSKGYLLKFSAVIEDADGNEKEKQLSKYEIPLDEHRRPRVASSTKSRKFSLMKLLGLSLPAESPKKATSAKAVKVPKTAGPSKKATSAKAVKVPKAAAPSKPARQAQLQQEALKKQKAKEEQERKAKEERERQQVLKRLVKLEKELIQWMEGVNVALDGVLLNGQKIERKIHSLKSEAGNLKEKVNLAIDKYVQSLKNLENKDTLIALRNVRSPRTQLAELAKLNSNLDTALNNMDLDFTWDAILAGYVEEGYSGEADEFGEEELVDAGDSPDTGGAMIPALRHALGEENAEKWQAVIEQTAGWVLTIGLSLI